MSNNYGNQNSSLTAQQIQQMQQLQQMQQMVNIGQVPNYYTQPIPQYNTYNDPRYTTYIMKFNFKNGREQMGAFKFKELPEFEQLLKYFKLETETINRVGNYVYCNLYEL